MGAHPQRSIRDTIDAILAKSDLELDLELLTGRSTLFGRGRPLDRNRRDGAL
jgi:hypothetical protein